MMDGMGWHGWMDRWDGIGCGDDGGGDTELRFEPMTFSKTSREIR
jgi:hypothetical protein